MLIVVKRNLKEDTVDILDTADMVVETINFSEVKEQGSHLDIIGLQMYDGLANRLLLSYSGYFASGSLVKMKSVNKSYARLTLPEVKLYGQIPYLDCMQYTAYCATNYPNSLSRDLDEYSPLSYLLFTLTGLNLCSSIQEYFTIKLGEFVETIDKFGVSNILYMYLYMLYTKDVLDFKVYNEDIELFPFFADLLNYVYIYEYSNHVHFTDGKQLITVPLSKLHRVRDIQSRQLNRLKSDILNIPNKVNIATGEITVSDCKKLVMKDNSTYILEKGTVVIDKLIVNKDCRIKVSRTKLALTSFECTNNPRVANVINKTLSLDSLISYTTDMKSFNQASFSDLLIRHQFRYSAESNYKFDLYISDIKSAEDVIKFRDMFLSDSDLHELRSNVTIPFWVHFKLRCLKKYEIQYNVPSLYDADDYKAVSVEDFVDFINMHYPVKVTKDFILKITNYRVTEWCALKYKLVDVYRNNIENKLRIIRNIVEKDIPNAYYVGRDSDTNFRLMDKITNTEDYSYVPISMYAIHKTIKERFSMFKQALEATIGMTTKISIDYSSTNVILDVITIRDGFWFLYPEKYKLESVIRSKFKVFFGDSINLSVFVVTHISEDYKMLYKDVKGIDVDLATSISAYDLSIFTDTLAIGKGKLKLSMNKENSNNRTLIRENVMQYLVGNINFTELFCEELIFTKYKDLLSMAYPKETKINFI